MNVCLCLKLGDRHTILVGYVGLDRRELLDVDVAEAGKLPCGRGSVDEMFSASLVCRFSHLTLRWRWLPYSQVFLRSGGIFRAITSDVVAMLAVAAAGTYGSADFREAPSDGQAHVRDRYWTVITSGSLRKLLKAVGVVDIHVPVNGGKTSNGSNSDIAPKVPGPPKIPLTSEEISRNGLP